MRGGEDGPLTRIVPGAERRSPGDGKGASGGILETVRGIMGTLAAYWKLLVPLWLALSVLLVALIFLLPQEYSRTLTLSVTPSQTQLQASLAQPPMDPTQAKNQAVTFLEQADFGPVRVDPEYDPAQPQQQIRVQLESQNRRALADVAEEVVAVVEEGFQGTYEASLGTALERQLTSLGTQVEAQEAAVAGIEESIEATRPAGPDDVEEVVRLAVLESKRQDTTAAISLLESQMEPLEEAQENLSEVAAKPIAIEVASESPIRQNNPRAPSAAFAVLLGFVAAAGVVLRVAAVRRKKHRLVA